MRGQILRKPSPELTSSASPGTGPWTSAPDKFQKNRHKNTEQKMDSKMLFCRVIGCDKCYVNPEGLKSHIKRRHPETIKHRPKPVVQKVVIEPLTCPEEGCGAQYFHREGLRSHRRMKHCIQCPFCNFTSVVMEKLTAHIRQIHPTDGDDSMMVSEQIDVEMISSSDQIQLIQKVAPNNREEDRAVAAISVIDGGGVEENNNNNNNNTVNDSGEQRTDGAPQTEPGILPVEEEATGNEPHEQQSQEGLSEQDQQVLIAHYQRQREQQLAKPAKTGFLNDNFTESSYFNNNSNNSNNNNNITNNGTIQTNGPLGKKKRKFDGIMYGREFYVRCKGSADAGHEASHRTGDEPGFYSIVEDEEEEQSSDSDETKVAVKQTPFAVAIVTTFMDRVSRLPTSAANVFVDFRPGDPQIGRNNVALFLADTQVGPLPLGVVVFEAPSSEQDLVQGFRLLAEALDGQKSFGGQSYPQIFVYGRPKVLLHRALETVWPISEHHSNLFQMIKPTWQDIWKSIEGIDTTNDWRQMVKIFDRDTVYFSRRLHKLAAQNEEYLSRAAFARPSDITELDNGTFLVRTVSDDPEIPDMQYIVDVANGLCECPDSQDYQGTIDGCEHTAVVLRFRPDLASWCLPAVTDRQKLDLRQLCRNYYFTMDGNKSQEARKWTPVTLDETNCFFDYKDEDETAKDEESRASRSSSAGGRMATRLTRKIPAQVRSPLRIGRRKAAIKKRSARTMTAKNTSESGEKSPELA